MRIVEILLWNNDPVEGSCSNPRRDFSPGPFDSDVTNLAGAFTKDGKVKRFWDLNRLARQPGIAAWSDAEADVAQAAPRSPLWQPCRRSP